MPYNVNPACPTGQKTNITWQFPGQTAKTNDQGDDYKVYQKPGQCPNAIYTIKYKYKAGNTDQKGVSNPNSADGYFYKNVALPYGSRIINPIVRYNYTADRGSLAPPYWYPIGVFHSRLSASGAAGQYYTDLSLGFNSGFGADESTLTYEVLRSDNQLDNCGNWIVDIYKNGSIIQSDEGSLQIPANSWQCSGGSCPPPILATYFVAILSVATTPKVFQFLIIPILNYANTM